MKTLAVLATLAATPAFAGQLTVSGQGSIAVAPDMATITIGVNHQAKTASDAVSQMSEAMTDVITLISEAGIGAQDMQTSALRVDRIENYNNQTGKAEFEGFRASNRLTVRVLELDQLGPLLDAVFKNGANDLGQLQFGVQDPAPHEDAARRAAVAEARAKAEVYADAAAVTLGDLVSLSESGGRGGPVPMMEMAMRADSVPVAAGEMAITATVTMVYETQ